MEDLAPPTVNVRLSDPQVGAEARNNGMLSAEEASNLIDIPKYCNGEQPARTA